ncbi:MAG: protease [Proteobacteria bacterium]|nr:MAG: protease [Pseudomonadota bacterium]
MKSASAGVLAAALFVAGTASAATTSNPSDVLIKFKDASALKAFSTMAQQGGGKVQTLGSGNWVQVKLTATNLKQMSLKDIAKDPSVAAVQPNYPIHLLENYQLKDAALRAKLQKMIDGSGNPANQPAKSTAAADNPAIPGAGTATGSGADPDYSKQWGMNDIGANKSWQKSRGEQMVVAVIDTGVDYTHEDLVDNLWRNPGETGTDASGKDKATNGVDDDGNGFIDDVIGWDFATNDNKPYDLAGDPLQVIMQGMNPGHGTHCAGNVGARADNGKGVSGVAPNVKIMSMRFLTEKGQGTTAGAIQAIDYAVKMGAKVLSNSWGSEGEDSADSAENLALREAIQRAEAAGVLFVAAAGNGHSGVGYDNDTDAKPGYPASYDYPSIISVAAIAQDNTLGAFSNWGVKSVDIAAPGVVVYSTTVGSKYADTVVDMFGIKATWDGTSMAAPHVSGAAALYWSTHPQATAAEVKAAILNSATPVPVLNGKLVTGGKLNVENLMK